MWVGRAEWEGGRERGGEGREWEEAWAEGLNPHPLKKLVRPGKARTNQCGQQGLQLLYY
jgi:hypothetical protein